MRLSPIYQIRTKKGTSVSSKRKVIAYIRISTAQQNSDNQREAILSYAQQQRITVDECITVEKSSQKSNRDRRVDELLELLKSGDLLIVSELSRLGRSVGQVVRIVDTLVKNGIHFIAIKENIIIKEKADMQTKVMVTMFSLFSEIERDLISERTKEALAGLKKRGVKLGRPKGTGGKSKLDPHKEEIKELLRNGSTQVFIAKRFNTSSSNLHVWLKKQNFKNE